MKSYSFCTVVWGEKFINIFLKFTLPSLLANHNMPRLCDDVKINYNIYTDKSSYNLLKNSYIFKILPNLCNIRFNTEFLEKVKNQNQSDIYKIANLCNSHSLKEAMSNSEYWFRLQPDTIHANGNLLTLHKLINKKFNIIFVPSSIRVSDRILEILKRKKEENNSLDINNKELVYQSMNFAVKKEEDQIFDNFQPRIFQPSVYWSLGKMGFFRRFVIPGDLLCILPLNKNINFEYQSVSIESSEYLDQAVPDKKKWAFVNNSDNFFSCDISNSFEEGHGVFLKKENCSFFNKPSKIAIALSNINLNKSKILQNSFYNNITRYSSTFDIYSDKQWIRMERKTKFFALQVVILSKIFGKILFLKNIAEIYIKFYCNFFYRIKNSKKINSFLKKLL